MAKEEKKRVMQSIFTDYRDSFVELYPTTENKFHKQGESFKVHPDVAKRLIAKGLATEQEGEEDEKS